MRTWFKMLVAIGTVSCSSGSGGEPSGGALRNGGTSELDGDWDITAAEGSELRASQMTVSGGRIDGAIVYANEGTESDGCILERNRVEFSIRHEGDAIGGTFKHQWRNGGPECKWPANRERVVPFTASRPIRGTGLNGEWDGRLTGKAPFVALVEGLTAKAWDKTRRGADPDVKVSLAGGILTVTSLDERNAFAARRR